METVRFLVKRDIRGQINIRSISRGMKSPKFVFPINFQDPVNHPEGVRAQIASAKFKVKMTVPYVLRGEEMAFYVNPANGDLWYNGVELLQIARDQLF